MTRFKFCPDCGTGNEHHDTHVDAVMRGGRRPGHKKLRPADFDVEAFVQNNFEGLRAVTDVGRAALEGRRGSSDSSPDSGSSSGDDGEKPLPLPPVPEPEPLPLPPPPPAYDPPTIVPAQIKSQTGARKAWKQVLVDVKCDKHKEAFIWWIPSFLQKNEKSLAKHAPGSPLEVLHKTVLDKAANKTQAARQAWYQNRVEVMLGDVSKAPKP